MPANVVVGKDAQLVASFVAKYSGAQPKKNETNPGIQQSP